MIFSSARCDDTLATCRMDKINKRRKKVIEYWRNRRLQGRRCSSHRHLTLRIRSVQVVVFFWFGSRAVICGCVFIFVWLDLFFCVTHDTRNLAKKNACVCANSFFVSTPTRCKHGGAFMCCTIPTFTVWVNMCASLCDGLAQPSFFFLAACDKTRRLCVCECALECIDTLAAAASRGTRDTHTRFQC